jgi:succinate dehydrogenase / fumarate reductase cytochrome b subunit
VRAAQSKTASGLQWRPNRRKKHESIKDHASGLKTMEKVQVTGAHVSEQVSLARADAQQRTSLADGRPLSPHLGIWRWTITMALSIMHRFTGLALAVGAVLLVWWLMALATGPEAFAHAQALMGSPLGRLALFGFTLALFFHFLNGIRHLAWDAGLGFSLPAARATGVIVLLLSLALTFAAWLMGYAAIGLL